MPFEHTDFPINRQTDRFVVDAVESIAKDLGIRINGMAAHFLFGGQIEGKKRDDEQWQALLQQDGVAVRSSYFS